MRWKFLTVAAVVAGLVGSPAWAFDPDDPSFDPEKQFVITPFGAIIGDPARFTNLVSEMTGFTYVAINLADGLGPTVSLSLIEPAQNDKPGAGDIVILTPEEALGLIAALQKGGKWAETARENAVGSFEKQIALISGDEQADHSRLVFVSNDQSIGAVNLEKRVSGFWKRYRFSTNAGLKLAASLEHNLQQSLKTLSPLNSGGSEKPVDPEVDELFK